MNCVNICRIRSRLIFSKLLILALILVFSAASIGSAEPSERRSLIMPLAVKTLILDLATAGKRIVAVGWRGHILLSDDEGKTWRQVETPTRNMLTSVYFVDEKQGWAVGHSSVILATEDGGESWELQYSAPEEERPLFDVFVSGSYGFAVGAYAKFMVTEDGGRSWQPGELNIQQSSGKELEKSDDEDLPFDYHLNRIAVNNKGICYIAAEAGYIFRSEDGGHLWEELPSPYAGSFFGVLPLDGDNLLAYGLRGHVFRSENGGYDWRQIEIKTTALMTDAVRLSDSRIVIVGMAGVILSSTDNGRSFTMVQPNRISWTSVVQTQSQSLILGGERGVKLYKLTD